MIDCSKLAPEELRTLKGALGYWLKMEELSDEEVEVGDRLLESISDELDLREMAMSAYVGKCRNFFGRLSDRCRERLERVLENPTEENWDDAYSLIVGADGFTTLWQAWVKVDPSAPRSKLEDGPWTSVPDQLTLYRALREVTK